jgi:hypothetical protein
MIPGGHEAIRALLFMEAVYHDQKTDDVYPFLPASSACACIGTGNCKCSRTESGCSGQMDL